MRLHCDTSSYCFHSLPNMTYSRLQNFCSPSAKTGDIFELEHLHSPSFTAGDTNAVCWMQNSFAVSKYAHPFVCNDLMVGKCDTIVGKFHLWTRRRGVGRVSLLRSSQPEGFEGLAGFFEYARVQRKVWSKPGSSRGFRVNAPGNQFVRTCRQWTNWPSAQGYFHAITCPRTWDSWTNL